MESRLRNYVTDGSEWVARKLDFLDLIERWEDSSFVEPGVNLIAKQFPQIKEIKLYQSHYGNLSWQHGMCNPQSNESAFAIQNNLVNGTTNRMDEFQKRLKNGDFRAAGVALGQALHYLQDTHTPSHVMRNSNGEIKQFQDYTAQSPKLHGDADYLKYGSEQFNNAVEQSTALMNLAVQSKSNWCQLGNCTSFYSLSNNANAGGTYDEYKRRY